MLSDCLFDHHPGRPSAGDVVLQEKRCIPLHPFYEISLPVVMGDKRNILPGMHTTAFLMDLSTDTGHGVSNQNLTFIRRLFILPLVI